VRDVVEAIAVFGQPELLETTEKGVEAETLKGATQTDVVVAPLAIAGD
jgi:hypothetical protein